MADDGGSSSAGSTSVATSAEGSSGRVDEEGSPADSSSSTAAIVPDVGGVAPIMWHIESPADSARTWLVSPTGERVFWLGVNTVMRDKSCDGILDWIRRTDSTTAAHVEWARLSTGASGDERNDAPYCFNSVGGFSETNDFDDQGGDSWMIRAVEDGGAGAPYGVVLNVDAAGDDRALRDEQGVVLRGGFAEARIGDPFNPAFATDLQARVLEDVAPRVGDPRLQMWFLGNEIGLFDRAVDDGPGVRDLRRWIWSQCPDGSTIDAPQCAPHALASWLRDRYADVAAMNTAWESSYASFDVGAEAKPVPYAHDCNLACREDLQRFVHDVLAKRWVELVTTTVRATDPDHLLTSPRMAVATSATYRFWTPDGDVWAEAPDVALPHDGDVVYSPFDLFARDGDAGFDLIAINIYDGAPTFAEPWLGTGLARMHEQSGLPIIVSEFSVRARIDGWTNRGGAGSFVPDDDETDDQIQRGAYYRSQIEQLASYPYVLGASWHAWSDRFLAADPAHQIDMGLLQCQDPPRGFEAGARWGEIDDRIADTNCTIMDRIAELTGL
ncbi:MAG TPA: hypothetical protein VG755_03810 [Nannocystaceae bacterium]|nr:hypothetical protein [Nannocystaceae bacterium]